MTFAQRRNRLTTHFSERIPVVSDAWLYIRVAHKTLDNRQLAEHCVCRNFWSTLNISPTLSSILGINRDHFPGHRLVLHIILRPPGIYRHEELCSLWCKEGEVPVHAIKAHRSNGVRRGGLGVQPPTPKFRRPSTIVPNSTRLWKLLKIAEFRTPTPQDVRRKGSKILKLPGSPAGHTSAPYSGSQDHHQSTNSVQKTVCCNSTSNAPDDGRM